VGRELKSEIKIYCRCIICGNYFDIAGKRRRKYCSKKCVNKNYYRKKLKEF